MGSRKKEKTVKNEEGKLGIDFKTLVDILKDYKKIKIKDLKIYTLICLKTTNSSYKIALIDPKTGVCVICGTNKEFFSKPVRCRIEGAVSISGSSSLYSGVIIEGFCVEIVIYSLNKRLWLSSVERMQVQPDSKMAKEIIKESYKNIH
ncbi:MAG: hypothetical protein L3J07_04030 [Candidatus Magasanikbacteria bacterium]|nr:hypothetical protein [Candidatus Magasanikbacteria bacterium]